MQQLEIKDNFLTKKEFKHLQSIIFSPNIAWYWNADINTAPGYDKKANASYFTHNLFDMEMNYIYSQLFRNFDIFFDKLRMKSLIRAKLNFYMPTAKVEVHNSHSDYSFDHKACVFSFNTCDGGTIVDPDEENLFAESIENRAAIFNGKTPHSSTSTTNAKGRFNINFNYF